MTKRAVTVEELERAVAGVADVLHKQADALAKDGAVQAAKWYRELADGDPPDTAVLRAYLEVMPEDERQRVQRTLVTLGNEFLRVGEDDAAGAMYFLQREIGKHLGGLPELGGEVM